MLLDRAEHGAVFADYLRGGCNACAVEVVIALAETCLG